MHPFFLFALLGGAAYFFLKEDDKKQPGTNTGGGNQPPKMAVPAVMAQIPQFTQLPADVQQQIAAVLASGGKEQLVSLAKQLDATYGPQVKPVTDTLRSVAAMKL